jgi:hypothetical protein
LDKELAEFKLQATHVASEAARIQAERDELQAAKDDIRDQGAAVESARQHLEHDRQKARELSKEVERDKKKYGELRNQYEADQRLLKVAREELESARTELRQQNEKFEASRVAYMEERAQVAKKEADIHKALKQLRDERKRLQPGEDALSTWSLTQTPKETVADLQILLGRLHDERTRLKVEREQLAQIFSLISRAGGLGGTRASKSGSRQDSGPRIDGPRLRMILEPGTASSTKLSDLLSELSLLDRLLGGPGVEFVVRECRIWQLSALASRTSPDPSTAAAKPDANAGTPDRSFVEIYAVPQKVGSNEGNGKSSASHWDRFTASLFMVLRLDAGQANYFDLAETASREHPSYVLAADAALRASRKPKANESAAAGAVGNAAAADKATAKEASVDAINLQLQRIEELRRKFEREDSLVLELAPAVDVASEQTVIAPAAAPITLKSKNRLALTSGAVAAAAALLAGIWWFFRGF